MPVSASIAAGSALAYNKLPSVRNTGMMAPAEAAEAAAEGSPSGDPSTGASAFSLNRGGVNGRFAAWMPQGEYGAGMPLRRRSIESEKTPR